ncbi:hypothetical protein J2X54_003863 [Duganella sp. 3397]|uniref:hypothetical protein n=1 Tax=Duganella sp. 3397 TaxID=2817732 RepID=UPI0028603222|nr:hypothetical protein [Duganella sp. 3397]MDR7051376.1 hypothetical protein [Duganella sp. 3397]
MSNHYLDVAIGLSFTFLAVSLLCSATREAIASLFQTRAKVLLDGVLTMLHESAAKPRLRGVGPSIARLLRRDDCFGLDRLGDASLAADVMRHPLIVGMAQRGRMPSYIPAPIFARAFVSTLIARYGKAHTAQLLLASTGNDGLARTLLAIMGEGPNDAAALENAVRIWYETVMERITGWYKRRSQLVLFCVGLFYAGAMNIDALVLSQRLWQDDSVAAELAKTSAETIAAGRVKADPAATPAQALGQAVAAQKAIDKVAGLPVGWPSSRFENSSGQGAAAWMLALGFALLGWIATAFASSLGAPFWFDGVGWLLALRGTGVKPPVESVPATAVTVLPSLTTAVREN